jgi:hypothetical protein
LRKHFTHLGRNQGLAFYQIIRFRQEIDNDIRNAINAQDMEQSHFQIKGPDKHCLGMEKTSYRFRKDAIFQQAWFPKGKLDDTKQTKHVS